MTDYLRAIPPAYRIRKRLKEIAAEKRQLKILLETSERIEEERTRKASLELEAQMEGVQL